SIFYARINVIGIVQRWFQMPDALKFPRMLSAVVPLVGRERFPRFRRSVVNEFIAFAFRHAIRALQFLRSASRRVPPFATVVGTLNDLPEPSARLRRVDPVGINRRTFHVINFPTREMRAAYFPSFTRTI